MKNLTFVKLLLFVLLLTSCEKDFNEQELYFEFETDELNLLINDEFKVQIENISPNNLIAHEIVWETNDSLVATVNNGTIKAIGKGSTSIFGTLGDLTQHIQIKVEGVNDPDNDVYILGTDSNQIVLWKNGIPTQITNDETNPLGTSLFIDNTDIYIGGRIHNELNQSIPVYWKNGKKIILSNQPGWINDISVLNGKCYAVGILRGENGIQHASLWINGVQQFIHYGDNLSSAYAIQIVNSDIHIVGKSNIPSQEIHDQERLLYWKNGEIIELTQKSATAVDIAIDGTDIYILGSIISENQGYSTLWKNGVETKLEDPNFDFVGRSVNVRNGSILISGLAINSDTDIIYNSFWLDNDHNVLNYEFGHSTNKIVSDGVNSYAIFNALDKNKHYSSFYMKNNQMVLFEGRKNYKFVSDIQLVPKR